MSDERTTLKHHKNRAKVTACACVIGFFFTAIIAIAALYGCAPNQDSSSTEMNEATDAATEVNEESAEVEETKLTYGGNIVYLSTYKYSAYYDAGWTREMINELAGIVLEQHDEDCEKLDEIYDMLEEINEKLDALMASSGSE